LKKYIVLELEKKILQIRIIVQCKKMSHSLNFLDLFVLATILLFSTSSTIFATVAPTDKAIEASASAEAAADMAAMTASVKTDLPEKQVDAVVKESGARKRDGAVISESGSRKRGGVADPPDVAADPPEVAAEHSQIVAAMADKLSMTTPAAAAVATAETAASTASANGTIPEGLGEDALQNRGMIFRMTYVLCGFSLLILIYFVVKAVQLRRAKSRSRKYGVLTENLDSPLGMDDESDEEVEVFEVNGTNLRGGRGSKSGDTAADRLLP